MLGVVIMNKNTKKGSILNKVLMLVAIPALVAFGVFAGTLVTNKDAIDVMLGQQEIKKELTVPMEEFLLNLKPSSSNKGNEYMRLEVALGTTRKKGDELLEERTIKNRDIIINVISKKSAYEIFNQEDGIGVLKEELKTALNEDLKDDLVSEVYITNIVTQ